MIAMGDNIKNRTTLLPTVYSYNVKRSAFPCTTRDRRDHNMQRSFTLTCGVLSIRERLNSI